MDHNGGETHERIRAKIDDTCLGTGQVCSGALMSLIRAAASACGWHRIAARTVMSWQGSVFSVGQANNADLLGLVPCRRRGVAACV